MIGDLHYGGLEPRKAHKLMLDLTGSLMVPVPVAFVQLGDVTEQGTSHQDAAAVAYLNRLPAPWYAAIGNHDMWGGPASATNPRTGALAAASLGLPAVNYTVDLGFALLIVVGPDQLVTGDRTMIQLPSATIAWLDTQLRSAGKDCLIACHAPLEKTVLTGMSSAYPPYQVHKSSDIAKCLADNPNAKVWVSGHTHTVMEDPDLVTTRVYGGHTVAVVNASAIHYVGTSSEFTDPIRSLFLTYLDGVLQVRFRDHGARSWLAPAGNGGARVATVNLT